MHKEVKCNDLSYLLENDIGNHYKFLLTLQVSFFTEVMPPAFNTHISVGHALEEG